VYLFLSVIGLIMFIGVFWLSPSTVDESLTLGIYQTGMDELIDEFQEGADDAEGLSLVQIGSEKQLEAVIAGDLEAWRADSGEILIRDEEAGDPKPENAERVDVPVGIAFPARFIENTAAGTPSTVRVYTDAATPPEIKGAMTSFVREIAFSISGNDLPVTEPEQEQVVLGEDRAGNQVSMREKMRPMLALFVLMIEVLALASLISTEVLTRTVQAVLVTPAKVGDFLAAKTIYGTMLAGSQALIVLVAIGAFTAENWFLLLVTMLIGSLMFTGVAMVVGSAGKDFIGTIFYSMLFLIPLMIPAFSILFPGSASTWVRVLPTYGLVQVLVNVTSYSATWSDVAPYLATTVAWVAALYLAGLFTLKRKVETL
jgi:ABC-2 type transport system permease protein